MSPGLCETCTHVRVVRSDRGSLFYRCGLADTDPRFDKYPRLPVLRCVGFNARDDNPGVPPETAMRKRPG